LKYIEYILIVRLLPPSIRRSDRLKFDGRKKRQYFSNGKSEFNGTKKFGITTKNYIGQKQQINNSKQVRNAEVKQGNETKQKNRSMEQEHGQKEHYIHREDNGKERNQTSDWMSRLRPRTRPTIPGSSTKKHKEKMNPK